MQTPSEVRSEKIATRMCEGLNVMGFCSDSFEEVFIREHRTIQQNVFRAILGLIIRWAMVEDKDTDARNEHTVKTCRRIVAALESEDLCVPNI